jgi:hypothetical protein
VGWNLELLAVEKKKERGRKRRRNLGGEFWP